MNHNVAKCAQWTAFPSTPITQKHKNNYKPSIYLSAVPKAETAAIPAEDQRE
jgi:hypothetical protein